MAAEFIAASEDFMSIQDFTEARRAEITRGVRMDDPRTIRTAMRAARISIADVSRAARVNYSRLEKVVNGRAKARPEELVAIAEAIGLSAADLRGPEASTETPAKD